MKNGRNEFLGLLCNLYIIALLVALPMYTGQGYWQLGNTKYTLFYNVSMLCLGCWLLLGMPGRIRAFADTMKRSRKKQVQTDERGENRPTGLTKSVAGCFSMMDCAVAAYGICVLVSALCSSYGRLAWEGYDGWFMGAVSQLLFVAIYFFVSRQYDGAKYPLYLGETAVFLVTVFGLLHRLGIDPLGLLEGLNSGDWEYSHMMSTLGNINWLCGFYSVALALVMVHFLREERPWFRMILYVEVIAAFVLLGIQGSQGGLLILGVCAVACVLAACKQPVVLRRIFLALTGFFLCMPLMWQLMKLRGKKAAIVADGNVFDHVAWYYWVIAAMVSLLLVCLLSRKVHEDKSDRQASAQRDGQSGRQESAQGDRQSGRQESTRRDGQSVSARKDGQRSTQKASGKKKPDRIFVIGILFAIAAIGFAAVLWVLIRSGNDGFGSGRGFLWRIAVENFQAAGIKDKLLGAGPDCYGLDVFEKLGIGSDVWKGDHWEDAIYTNAHNEFLSQLCNIGILGTISYLAIFLIGLDRYGGDVGSRKGRCWLGVLVILMYGAHSLISFQQVLSTPLFFLTLGLCEAGMRYPAEETGTNSRMTELE